MECIILAGGLGTRLRPVVADVPKCMAPISGKPFLYYLLQWLNKYDVSRVVLSVGYLYEIIEKWIAENKNLFKFEIDFAIENEPLGTGGAIRLSLGKINSDKTVIINGDTFFDIDMDSFIKLHNQYNAILSIALKPMKNFDRYGNVLIENNKIVNFKEKGFCENGFISGGIYVMNKENSFFEDLPEKFSFETEVLQPSVKKGWIDGYIFDNSFIDIGLPEDFLRANQMFANTIKEY